MLELNWIANIIGSGELFFILDKRGDEYVAMFKNNIFEAVGYGQSENLEEAIITAIKDVKTRKDSKTTI